jgi:hypothetical protein
VPLIVLGLPVLRLPVLGLSRLGLRVLARAVDLAGPLVLVAAGLLVLAGPWHRAGLPVPGDRWHRARLLERADPVQGAGLPVQAGAPRGDLPGSAELAGPLE